MLLGSPLQHPSRCGCYTNAQGNIENTDFVHTDIPSPFDVALPDVQHYPEGKSLDGSLQAPDLTQSVVCMGIEVREEVRNWVLDHSLSVGGMPATISMVLWLLTIIR